MATVQCSKCTAEKRGFRRELDSWRHKLIHCVGFESILEGIYGPLLLRDLNLFDDCQPDEVADWSQEGSCSYCSFCNLPLDKLSDQVATPPLSSPSDYSPCHVPSVSESSQSAHRFLQAVFHKKDVSLGYDSNIPLIAQELMKKMIHQFAMEYASKCLLHTSTKGATTRTSSPVSETSDAPLDLTVSRTQEEKETEPQPDGVLDLSNRNSACSAISKSSSSTSNHKASGCRLPSFAEESGEVGQQETKCPHICALDAIFSSLCPSHRSLLYQILKLAQQEKLLFYSNQKAVGQTESYCCHCGVNPQDNVTPNQVELSNCKSSNSSQHFPLTDCDHQGNGSTRCHQGDSKSNCSIHHYPLKDCNSEASRCTNYCCKQRCERETCTLVCPKRLHCISCQSHDIDHINNRCSFANSPSLPMSPSMCTSSSGFLPSSVCCNQHSLCSFPCYLNHVCLTQARNTIEGGVGDRDPPCPVLKREQSPSPPPLSPIPSDIDKQSDEKPPSLLHHIQEEKTGLTDKDCVANTSHKKEEMAADAEERLDCRTPRNSQAERNPSGTLLQDVVNRFSERLDTIRPLEKDAPLTTSAVSVMEKEQLQVPSTSQNLHFHADAHLTEIITTVLHTGRASEYNLSELFNRQDNKVTKSPNTRSRRRQEVLAALATPADDASTRRHTLQIKRELALLDQSYNKRKVPLAKKARLKDGKNISITTSSLIKEESKGEMEVVMEDTKNMLTTETDRDEVKEDIQTVVVTDGGQVIKAEENEKVIFGEKNHLTLLDSQIPSPTLLSMHCRKSSRGDRSQLQVMTMKAATPRRHSRTNNTDSVGSSYGKDGIQAERASGKGCDGEDKTGSHRKCQNPVSQKKKCQLNHSKEARKSRRNIVPPQRFSSYVTEPRKMYFVACFSESIFNHRTHKDKDLIPSTLDASPNKPDANDAQIESRKKESPDSTGEFSCNATHGELSEALNTNDQSKVSPPTLTTKEKSLGKQNNLTDCSKCIPEPRRRLRPSPKKLQDSTAGSEKSKIPSDVHVVNSSATCDESPSNSHVQYTSPIKLMFVSQVKDKGEIKYSLKSAGFGSSAHAGECFDPCEESSWSGTPEKNKNKRAESASSQKTSPLKSATSPTKSPYSSPRSASSPAKSSSSPKTVSSPAKSASSPKSTFSSPKSATSPAKSVSSPKSASSSPKTGSRRSGEITPTKRAAEIQRSSGDLLSFHETTPPKRRPGRPKKLGPQLENKVKRPIGRPRKLKAEEPVTKETTKDGNSAAPSESEENVNKNLKITVVYGRSRRNKRMVSEGFDQLQTEFHDAWQAVSLNSDWSMLMQNSKTSARDIKTASTELSEELTLVRPVKEFTTHSSSNIKCQMHDDAAPSRKPGRPAKVKISGISVTVTTVSPRQRKIQINKDTRQSTQNLNHKKALIPEIKSAKEPRTITRQSASKSSQVEERTETTDESKDKEPDPPVAVRHSLRVRKPSIYFLHAVATATSRSYSRSNALLRRSKQLLLNKACSERKQGAAHSNTETSGEKRHLFGQERRNISRDLSQVAGVSVDSIFTPKETVKWWAASAQEKTLNQELARRIRLISDTWVSDTVDTAEQTELNSKLDTKCSSSLSKKSKRSSVVRTLFDCSPNKPRSCSMQQLCSWFMQTTETQSLAIVKKASSRNPYEVMHFPRSTNNKSVCHSPQAERLRKHIKKFAKTVPKSPFHYDKAQKRLRKRKNVSSQKIRRQLFTTTCATGKVKHRIRSKTFGKYQATLFRARTRFLTQKERERERKRPRKWRRNGKTASRSSDDFVVSGLQPKRKALHRSTKGHLSAGLENTTSSVGQTVAPVDAPKEQNLCSKAWSPETLKECRVFLRKINSPDNESTEEEWDSCTVTLDDGSPSALLFAGKERKLVGVVKTVKTKRKRSLNGTASRDSASPAPKSVQGQDEVPVGRQKGKYRMRVVSTEPPQPPPAKMLRQSRMRGLSGLRWRDFVFEN